MRRERWSFCGDAFLPGSREIAATIVGLGCLLASPPAQALDLGDGFVRLRHVTYAAEPSAPGASRVPALPDAAPRRPVEAWLVAFEGDRDAEVRASIGTAGGRVVGYVASSAYVVRGGAATAQALRHAPGVRRVDLVRDEWRLMPGLTEEVLRSGADPRVFVDVFAGEDAHAVAERLRGAGLEVLGVEQARGLARLVVRLAPGQLDDLSAVSAVEWVEPLPVLTLRNDNTRWVIQSNDSFTQALPLYDRGLLGQDEIIGHIDVPLNPDHCFFLDPAVADPGPTHRKLVSYEVNTGWGGVNHGAHTAGTACGENWDAGLPGNRGMAPKARLAHVGYGLLDGDLYGTPSNLLTLLAGNHELGARIHTNSWGDDSQTGYTDWCVDVDAFAREYEDDLVVFACTNRATLRTPENAKNCLSAGATFGPDLQDSISAGGEGPTPDGRRKPEVFAPGRAVVSSGTAICNLVTNSGTSMAAPAVAGGAALVRQYYRRGFYPKGRDRPANGRMPTGALIKATVINSTVDMTREPDYPGTREGWGRILLDDALFFEGETRRLWMRDVRHDDGLATGDVRQWPLVVLSSAEPLAITLAFMDVPGTHMASEAAVNDLDLEVDGPDGLFRGNVFDTAAGVSVPNGSADLRNNVERVILPAPTPGTWTVRVRGRSVPMGPQGFAVVANGDFPARGPEGALAPDLGGDDPPGGPGDGGLVWQLQSPRPTPFRGSADVPYVVPTDAHVTIRVYDVSGRVVRVLLDRPVEAGEHVAAWDGRSDAGAAVGPGVYLLRLTAPGVERAARTVLLR